MSTWECVWKRMTQVSEMKVCKVTTDSTDITNYNQITSLNPRQGLNYRNYMNIYFSKDRNWDHPNDIGLLQNQSKSIPSMHLPIRLKYGEQTTRTTSVWFFRVSHNEIS